jgi:hypothetical protein
MHERCALLQLAAAAAAVPPSCRLWQTREVLHQCLINPQLSVRQALLDTDSYLDVQVRTGAG